MKNRPGNIYFLGIGGIGMSALAKYFQSKNYRVMGYDLTKTPLTAKLEESGIEIIYNDKAEAIPDVVKTNHQIPVIYTPAIPSHHPQLNYFRSNGYPLQKRAEVLGAISSHYKTIAIAGTHGKTTTSAMVAHIMNHSDLGCMAFVGGIMSGYESNVILNTQSEWMVVEADEFDRSFLKLQPDVLGITSIDPDHLDIYSDASDLERAFQQLIKSADPAFQVIVNDEINPEITQGCQTYGLNRHSNIVIKPEGYQKGYFRVKVSGFGDELMHFDLAMPGLHNAQNAILAAALCKQAGCPTDDIKSGLKTFKGVKRRFEYIIKTPDLIYIDDYAHHPREIDALISSVRNLYPGRKITGIFQPHLYSRTRDFADEFAESLSKLDTLYLLDIYPAREKPLPGIDANFLLQKVQLNQKSIVDKLNVLVLITQNKPGILLTIGAGDIGQLVPAVKQILTDKNG